MSKDSAPAPALTATGVIRAENKRTVILLFIGLMITMLMSSLSQTILSTALPTIVGELGGVEHMTWVVTGYILASTVTMPVYGRISDLFGRKPVILVAIILFVAGSVVGGFANDISVLVAARVLQGIGGGGLMILSQSAIADVVPARDRAKYMGIMSAVFAVSSVAGPLVGGWLTEGPGWRWAFWMNIPLGVLSIVATIVFMRLPKVQRTERPKIDYLGMALIAAATVAVVLVCTWGGSEYDWMSPQIIGLIAGAVVLAALFVWVESKAAQPVIPLSLFRSPNFVFATAAGLFTGIAMFGVISYMPTYVQMVTGVNATQAGMLMIPMMGCLLLASVLSGNLVSRTGKYKIYPIVGTIIMGIGLYLLSTLTIDTPTWIMCTYIGIFGAGLGLGQQILTLVVQDAFPARIVGTATASFNYFKQVGATVGSAIVGAVFASRLTELLTQNLAGVGPADTDHSSLTPAIVASLPDAVRIPVIESYNEALLPIFFWLLPVVIVGLIVVLFIKEKALSTAVKREIPAESLAEGNLLEMVDIDPADGLADSATDRRLHVRRPPGSVPRRPSPCSRRHRSQSRLFPGAGSAAIASGASIARDVGTSRWPKVPNVRAALRRQPGSRTTSSSTASATARLSPDASATTAPDASSMITTLSSVPKPRPSPTGFATRRSAGLRATLARARASSSSRDEAVSAAKPTTRRPATGFATSAPSTSSVRTSVRSRPSRASFLILVPAGAARVKSETAAAMITTSASVADTARARSAADETDTVGSSDARRSAAGPASMCAAMTVTSAPRRAAARARATPCLPLE